jgi:hypothetical protein
MILLIILNFPPITAHGNSVQPFNCYSYHTRLALEYNQKATHHLGEAGREGDAAKLYETAIAQCEIKIREQEAVIRTLELTKQQALYEASRWANFRNKIAYQNSATNSARNILLAQQTIGAERQKIVNYQQIAQSFQESAALFRRLSDEEFAEAKKHNALAKSCK